MVKVKESHDFLNKIRVVQQKHGLLVKHGRQALISSLQRTKGKSMEPQTEENASNDEEFDLWSFQAHEGGVGETTKRNYNRYESMERKRDLCPRNNRRARNISDIIH
jgi:hypothetical protein